MQGAGHGAQARWVEAPAREHAGRGTRGTEHGAKARWVEAPAREHAGRGTRGAGHGAKARWVEAPARENAECGVQGEGHGAKARWVEAPARARRARGAGRGADRIHSSENRKQAADRSHRPQSVEAEAHRTGLKTANGTTPHSQTALYSSMVTHGVGPNRLPALKQPLSV